MINATHRIYTLNYGAIPNEQIISLSEIRSRSINRRLIDDQILARVAFVKKGRGDPVTRMQYRRECAILREMMR